MNEEIIFTGLWWLPERHEEKTCGTIKYVPDARLNLTLFGDLSAEVKKGNFSDAFIILGINSEGKKITLFNCRHAKVQTANKQNTNYYQIEWMFIGQHFENEDLIKFIDISIRFEHLENWLPVPKNTFDRITTNQPEQLVFHLKAFDLIFYWITSTEMYKCETRPFVEIRLDNLESFHYLIKLIHTFQDFVSLAFDDPIRILELVASTEPIETAPNSKIEIYHINKRNYVEKISRYDLFFTYNDVCSYFKDVMNEWYENVERTQSVYELYFGVLYSKGMYLQHIYLSLSQALEIYHRRKFDDKYLEEKQFEELKGCILDSINEHFDENISKMFENKISYLNQYTFKKRIKDILKTLHQHNILKWSKKERNEFVKHIGDTRDYLTHYEVEYVEYDEANFINMYKNSEIMRSILKAYFLIDLGLPIEDIVQILVDDPRIKEQFKL